MVISGHRSARAISDVQTTVTARGIADSRLLKAKSLTNSDKQRENQKSAPKC